MASAQLVNANATLERHQAVISQALAVTRADAADLRFAESEVQRHRNLASEGAGTRQAYEQARSRLDMTQARQAEHQATLQATRKQQDVLAAQHEAAQAGVLRAQALVDRAELNLSHTRIISPVDGVVGRARAWAPRRPGTPILAVVPLQQAYVVANFREKQLTHMRPGQPATVTVDAYPDLRLRGTVSIAPATGLSLSPVAPSNATGNFTKIAQRLPVKIVLDATPAGARCARACRSRPWSRPCPCSRRPRNEPVENTAPGPDLGAVEPGRLRRGTGLPGASGATADAMARCRRGRPGQRAGGPACQRRLVGQLRRP